MKARTLKSILLTVPLSSAIIMSSAVAAAAQAAQDKPAPAVAGASSAQPNKKEFLGPTADSIRPYKPAGRDPFRKAFRITPGAKPTKQMRALGFPPLDVRRSEFRQKVDSARARELPEPNPLSQYLVGELDVTGVFRDEHGFGAFVRAQPTGTMFFVRRGTACYNGEVLRIEGDESESGGAKVMFREVSYLEVNGKQSPQERVVAKLPGTK